MKTLPLTNLATEITLHIHIQCLGNDVQHERSATQKHYAKANASVKHNVNSVMINADAQCIRALGEIRLAHMARRASCTVST